MLSYAKDESSPQCFGLPGGRCREQSGLSSRFFSSASATPRSYNSCSTPSLNNIPHEHIHKLRQDIDELSERLISLREQLSTSYDSTIQSSTSSLVSIPPPPPPIHHAISSSALQSLSSASPDAAPALPPRTYRRRGPLAPPKPTRTFEEECELHSAWQTTSATLKRRFTLSQEVNTEWSTMRTINLTNLCNSDTLCDQIKSLFNEKICWFELGPLTCFVNPYNDLAGSHCTAYNAIGKIIDRVLENSSANVILNGDSGSGKSYIASELAVRLCERVSRVGSHLPASLRAAVTLLSTFTSIRASDNNRRSFACTSYSFYMANGVLSRIVIHCVMSPLPQHLRSLSYIFRNFVVGLSNDEKGKYHLWDLENDGASVSDGAHKYSIADIRRALNTLGIAFEDVARVMSSCYLLSGINFVDVEGGVDVEKQRDLESAASLLGVSPVSLYKQFTKHAAQADGHSAKLVHNAASASLDREVLIRSLLSRCVTAVIRRANSLLHSSFLASSSDGESSSVNDSGIGISSEPLSSQVTIFDGFGFSTNSDDFDTLCVNIGAEKWRNAYKDKIFSQLSPETSFLIEKDFPRNALNDFLAPEFGILYQLDAECDKRCGTAVAFVEKIRESGSLMRCTKAEGNRLLVKHFDCHRFNSYACEHFITRNRNLVKQSMVDMFAKDVCSFGFVSHIFAPSLGLTSRGSFCETHTASFASTNQKSAEINVRTFCEDFVFEIDKMIKRMGDGASLFVHCFKSNSSGEYAKLDSVVLAEQIHSYELDLIMNLTQLGFPYIHKIGDFTFSYSFLHGGKQQQDQPAESLSAIAKELLRCFLRAPEDGAADESMWKIANDKVLLSFRAHQQLEELRHEYNLKNRLTSDCGESSIPLQVVRSSVASEIRECPQIPKRRNYIVKGFRKQCFPQRRILCEDYTDELSGIRLLRNDIVKVVAYSKNANTLRVEHNGKTIDVPEQFTRISLCA